MCTLKGKWHHFIKNTYGVGVDINRRLYPYVSE